jgi:hypothetical protein
LPGDALLVHAARQERAPVEHLVALLAVGVIETRAQQRRQVVVGERLARAIPVRELPPPRVALGADVELGAGRARRVARGVARRRVDHPGHALALVEGNGQAATGGRGVTFGGIASQRDVVAARAVTGLATDDDLGPCRREAARRRIEILAYAGGVAVGAHEIPVLLALCPVQLVGVRNALVRVKVEPALATLVLRPCVPGEGQRLDAASVEFDQVLLQGIDAEGMGHLEVGKLAVGAVRAHHELAVAAEELARDAVLAETHAGEVAEHRLLVRRLHRHGVLRSLPALVFVRVAIAAGGGAHILGRSRGCGGKRRLGVARRRRRTQDAHAPRCGESDQQGEAEAEAGRDDVATIRHEFLVSRSAVPRTKQ